MRYVIFGESHGPAIGVVLEGVPAGLVCLVFGVVLYLCALIAQGALPRRRA